jgi:hypothetical protein
MLANRLDTYLCALYPDDAGFEKHYFTVVPGKGMRIADIIYPNPVKSVEIEYEAIDRTV